MIEAFNIAGYCRISVDEELDRDNTSIENQKAIIEDYVKRTFPGSTLTIFEDRDRSGYTFEQREGYQQMRRGLTEHKYDMLIIKDFSRFSRRNGRGLVELEDLRDAGVRIISIGDGIDYPTNDDWLQIQLHFFINEMPVTDTSKKVKNVIKRRQSDGKWICAVPYGYVITNTKNMTFEIDEAAAEVVRMVFRFYNEGWGYKKIANHLTELNIPTPRTMEKERAIAAGAEYKTKTRPEWSIITIQGILDNDFYIGTLRQHKYTRKKINGADIKIGENEHIVFENHHEPIVDYRTFAIAREQRQKRGVTNYRGVKIHDNAYSGFLYCGDCKAPMFSMSRRDLRPAYTCGTYHRRGLKGCTSHHTRVDVLDALLKSYIRKIKENSADMIEKLEASIKNEHENTRGSEDLTKRLSNMLDSAREELKAAKRQKIREIMKRPDSEEFIEETYAEIEAELEARIDGLRNQLNFAADKRNTTIRVNRIARTAIEIFDGILTKDKLDKRDLELIIDRINVYEDHLEIKLKQDIDMLLKIGVTGNGGPMLASAPTETVATPDNICSTSAVGADAHIGPYANQIVQISIKHPDKVFHVNVINDGDPLEIYTDKDGEVIFKKYSPMGELSSFASQICETLSKTTGWITAVSDRDSIISISGGARRELLEKRLSEELERIMESRQVFQCKQGETRIPVSDGVDKLFVGVAAPIIAEGDVSGCVLFISTEASSPISDTEYKLAQTVAGFLGKQMES